ncbi:TIGR03086 family metal-binding protein [Saccharopolyspora sp. WRP15-2]|uniref:TIGR03086 family metal-binding protein n=1 Tax=Saccharopolyspora oryzae TaxID=2997343 RepID=A0ABT4VBC8_9PSEU|nr:TIGR03086 family metal-binding protein [Saccharopolyspora oryzae]MDA3631275.1 TIGR03086 family metal-binding protein [Saccharopolyspora oryzae]
MVLLAPSVEQLGRALEAVGHLVSGIREGQWSNPTPCTDWTVEDLVNHLVDVNLAVAASLTHQAPPEPGTQHLNSSPVEVYVRSSGAVQAAFDQPQALERTYQGPFGETTGAALLLVRMADLLTHGWDLARATRRPPRRPGRTGFDIRPPPIHRAGAKRSVRSCSGHLGGRSGDRQTCRIPRSSCRRGGLIDHYRF